MTGIIGKKIGMSQIFKENGELVPVTVIAAGPCKVVQVKTEEKNGYTSIQLGFIEAKEQLMTKPELGVFKKANLTPLKHLVEIRDFDPKYCQVGETVTVAAFNPGDTIKVTGVSKGKGFQGVVRRHNFSGGPKTHGQSDRLRAPGSIGASAYPSHVIKGVRMAGRLGGKRCTVNNLTVVKIDPDNNLLYVKGAVPGSKNSILTIRRLKG